MVLLSLRGKGCRGIQEEFRLGLPEKMDRHGATLNGQGERWSIPGEESHVAKAER